MKIPDLTLEEWARIRSALEFGSRHAQALSKSCKRAKQNALASKWLTQSRRYWDVLAKLRGAGIPDPEQDPAD